MTTPILDQPLHQLDMACYVTRDGEFPCFGVASAPRPFVLEEAITRALSFRQNETHLTGGWLEDEALARHLGFEDGARVREEIIFWFALLCTPKFRGEKRELISRADVLKATKTLPAKSTNDEVLKKVEKFGLITSSYAIASSLRLLRELLGYEEAFAYLVNHVRAQKFSPKYDLNRFLSFNEYMRWLGPPPTDVKDAVHAQLNALLDDYPLTEAWIAALAESWAMLRDETRGAQARALLEESEKTFSSESLLLLICQEPDEERVLALIAAKKRGKATLTPGRVVRLWCSRFGLEHFDVLITRIVLPVIKKNELMTTLIWSVLMEIKAPECVELLKSYSPIYSLSTKPLATLYLTAPERYAVEGLLRLCKKQKFRLAALRTLKEMMAAHPDMLTQIHEVASTHPKSVQKVIAAEFPLT